jgi:DNA adenine methylase
MTTATRVDSPLKWHGGKSYLASKIVALMPPHTHYVEPYAGGLSVLLAKDPEGVSEVVNDLSGELANFWAVLRDEDGFNDLCRLCTLTPFSQADWEEAQRMFRQGTEFMSRTREFRAWVFFVFCRQSLAGRMESFAPLSRTRVRRGMNEQASAWLNAVEGLPAVHARLKRVVVLNRDAAAVIASQDGPATLFYLDPPYLKETRTAPEVYAHEMTADQHDHLLRCCTEIKGRFLLSGYRSDLYDRFAREFGWHRTDFDLPNNSAGGKEKRRMTECLWTNFAS